MFFNMFSKIIILNLLLFSMLPVFLNDFFMIWFMMEMNNFMFICLMCMKTFNKKIIFFYFIIQTMASLLIIFTLIFNPYFFQLNFFTMILIMSLNLKLGIPPFHLWMPLISMFLNWEILFFFLSIQKIPPLYIMSMIDINPLLFYLMILTSSYISTFKMIMLMNLKIILTYSSINQTSWMLLLIMFKNIFWFMYFIMYTIILLMIHLMFLFLKFSPNFFYPINPNNLQFIMMFLFFNLASLPPLSFFFMKWMSIYMFLFNSNIFLIFMIMLINSFILIYVYINMMMLLMFFYSMKSKMFYMSNYNLKKVNFILFLSLFMSLIMIMI